MKSNLYTRTGDDGSTSLLDGSRAGKDHLRVDTYGDIDELSSVLGLATCGADCPDELREEIRHIQNLLFDIGGYLATPVAEGTSPCLGCMAEETEKLEEWVDSLDERTPKLRGFILPGGCEGSSRLHMARTVCRRAERKMTALSRESFVDPEIQKYINRLSDYLFIAARYVNFLSGVEEITWKPRN